MTTLPPSERDLLIRLDTKFDNLMAAFERFQARQDANEADTRDLQQRVQGIEADRTGLKQRFYTVEDKVEVHASKLQDIHTTARLANKWVIAAWAVLGPIVVAILLKVFGLV